MSKPWCIEFYLLEQSLDLYSMWIRRMQQHLRRCKKRDILLHPPTMLPPSLINLHCPDDMMTCHSEHLPHHWLTVGSSLSLKYNFRLALLLILRNWCWGSPLSSLGSNIDPRLAGADSPWRCRHRDVRNHNTSPGKMSILITASWRMNATKLQN